MQLVEKTLSPSCKHMSAAKGVLEYLKSTPRLDLIFYTRDLKQIDYYDASYGRTHLTKHKSSTSFVFVLGSRIVSYASELQRVVAQSTTKRELIAGAEAANEAKYLLGILGQLRFIADGSCFTYEETFGALRLTEDMTYSP